MRNAFDAYVSYSHHDQSWVRTWLMPHLEAAGISVCIDFRDFDIGTPSIKNIEHAVERSRHTLLVITEDWIASEWTEFEGLLTSTLDPAARRSRLLPLVLKECQMPFRLQMLTWADFRNSESWDREFARLCQALGEPASVGTSLTDSEQPGHAFRTRLSSNELLLSGQPQIALREESDVPFQVDAIAVEDDTYMILSADPDFKPTHGSLKKAVKHATKALKLGSVAVKKGKPLRFLAIIHDLSREPTWTEASIQQALLNIFHKAEDRKLQVIGIPPLGTKHGSLEHVRFVELLTEALVSCPNGS